MCLTRASVCKYDFQAARPGLLLRSNCLALRRAEDKKKARRINDAPSNKTYGNCLLGPHCSQKPAVQKNSTPLEFRTLSAANVKFINSLSTNFCRYSGTNFEFYFDAKVEKIVRPTDHCSARGRCLESIQTAQRTLKGRRKQVSVSASRRQN